MAQQGIPGLVQVPPSDRQLFRRRVARLALVIVAVLGGLSLLNEWLPSADTTTDCEVGLDSEVSPDSREACGKPEPNQSATETQALQSDFDVAEVSQGTGQAESQKPLSMPATAAIRPTTQHEPKQSLPTGPQTSATDSSVRPVVTPREDTPAASQPAPKPAAAPTPDKPAAPAPTTNQTAAKPAPAPPSDKPAAQATAAAKPPAPAPDSAASQPAPKPAATPTPDKPAAPAPTTNQTAAKPAPAPPPDKPAAPAQTTAAAKPPAPVSDSATSQPAPKPAATPTPDKSADTAQVAPDKPTASASDASPGQPAPNQPPDKRLAEKGNAFAQYRLGKFYAKHKGPESAESLSWYKKASAGLRRLADAGNGQAMYVLGVMYAFGRGVQRDTEEARRWLTKAVKLNVKEARPVLARVERSRLTESERAGNDGG